MGIVYTSRIAYRGADRLDTTVKSGVGVGKLLAPTWELVGGVKRFETQGSDVHWRRYTPLNYEQYTAGYYALLRERYRVNAASFVDIVKCERMVLCCYCRPNTFCHRHLAIDILAKIAAAHDIPLTLGGELPTG